MDAQEGRERGESLEAELLDASQLEAIIAAQQEEEDAAQLAAALEMSTMDAAAFGNDVLLADSGDFEGGEDGADSEEDFDADGFEAHGQTAAEFAAFTVPAGASSVRTPVGGPSTAAVSAGVPASAAAAAAATVPAAGGAGAGAGAPFAHVTPAPRFAPDGLPDWARTIATVGAGASAAVAATVATVRADGVNRGHDRGSDRFSSGSGSSASSSFPDVSTHMRRAAASAASAGAGSAAGAGATGARLGGARLRGLLESADADSKHSDSDSDRDGDEDDVLAGGPAGQLGAAYRYSFARGQHHADADIEPATPVGGAAGGLIVTPPAAAAAAAAASAGVDDGDDDDDDDDDDAGMDADGDSDVDADSAEGAAAEEAAAEGDADAAADGAVDGEAAEGEGAAEGEADGEGEGEAEPAKPLGYYITTSIAQADGVPYTGLVEGEDAVALEVDIPPQEPLRCLLEETIVCVTSARAGCSIPELLDADTARCFWQSDGAAPHALTLQFYRRVSLAEVCLYLDFPSDESYCPQEILIKCGNSVAELAELRKITLSEPAGWVRFPFIDASKRGLRRYLRTQVVQLVVTANHASGRDCHVRGLQVYGPFSDPRLASAAERGWAFGAGVGAGGGAGALVEPEGAVDTLFGGGDAAGHAAVAAAAAGTFGHAGTAAVSSAAAAATCAVGAGAAAVASDFGFSFGLFDSIR